MERRSYHMMTPKAVFLDQESKFRLLFEEEVQRYGKPLGTTLSPPTSAIEFAEALLICPTIEAVRLHMRKDLEAARAFRVVAYDAAASVGKGHMNIVSKDDPDNGTPFQLLATVVNNLLVRRL